ncbi:MAG TPA: VOC family protein [Solirubrobacterales bacterium]|nr:VOC family protein [Solirubrobacterales bacterium]
MPQITSYDHGTPSWTDVAAPDTDAAAAFYSGLFGWDAGEAGDPEETGGYRMFSQGGKAVAGLGPIQQEGQPPAWLTYVTVDDADATAEQVKSAGGSVMMEPFDVMTAGRMAIFADPAGAVFAVWQPKDHVGAQLVNEPVSLCWNELRTRDPEGAKKFYGEVFGWDAMGFDAMEGYTIWTVGGNAPDNGKGGMMDMASAEMPDEIPPHWDIAFAVSDADATAAKCEELGGSVNVPPMDIAVGRMAGLADPAGATFTAIKLTPPEEMQQG